MARISIEVTKRIDFAQKAEDFSDDVMKVLRVSTELMYDNVRSNITMHGNIDTGTLIENLEKRVDLSEGGRVVTAEVASNVTSHPDGHRDYAPVLEYGGAHTRPYPNFIPALKSVEDDVMRDLGDIKL